MISVGSGFEALESQLAFTAQTSFGGVKIVLFHEDLNPSGICLHDGSSLFPVA